MIYAEFNLYGITDVPYISTMVSIDSSYWQEWNVRLTDSSIDINFGNETRKLYYQEIEYINRPTCDSIKKKIQNTSKCASFLIIDYRKKATIGHGQTRFSSLFAGKASDISKLKYYLSSRLGLKKNYLLGSMTAEEIRLLFLLAIGEKSSEILLPIFDNNKELIQKSFQTLRKSEFVDEYASITEKGKKILADIKESDHKKIGANIKNNFAELSKHWDHLDKLPSAEGTSSIVWKNGKSSLFGHVFVEDLWKYLPIKDITKIQFENFKIYGFGLEIQTFSNSTIYVKNSDFSVIIALHVLLNKKEDIKTILLFWFYIMSSSDTKPLFKDLNFTEYDYDTAYRHFIDHDFLDMDDFELTNKGLGEIKKILSIIKHQFVNDDDNLDFSKFKRYEEIKALNIKKRVLGALMKKHSN